MLNIAFSKSAIRVLRKMPKNDRERIQGYIAAYAENPAAKKNNVEKLQGRDGYRMRVGNWRVIFSREGNVIAILEIGARGQIYY